VQLTAIDVAWPPVSGWIDRAAGKEITEKQQRQFEEGRNAFSKYTIKKHKKIGDWPERFSDKPKQELDQLDWIT
jgi:hypothetical protein